ncbi:MAG: hypothetical protein IJ173_06530, partial [Kiritimatiellae bacterium]|nr:hypothetical protein [Kiritimatiellia bacterium]
QIALRAAPKDAKANRNFTRATDGLAELRETKRLNDVLKAAEGKDPGALLQGAVHDVRAILDETGTYLTNAAPVAVATGDRLAARTAKLADIWPPVKAAICQAVTNEEEAATITLQVDQAKEKTVRAAKEIGDLDDAGYSTLADVEHDFTRFLKMTVLPPGAMDEDFTSQTNAYEGLLQVNGRDWQADALDFTRAFRAKFPAWARAYEQQAQADTNKPPFTAEAQAKVSDLSTQLEKVQLACLESRDLTQQVEAMDLINQIRALLPKDGKGGSGGGQGQPPPKNDESKKDPPKNDEPPPNADDQQAGEQPLDDGQTNDEPPADEQPDELAADAEDSQEPSPEDREVEALLKKAQERSDEHEAEKKARMRKAPLPPNERDW